MKSWMIATLPVFFLVGSVKALAQMSVPVQAEVTWTNGDVTLEDIFVELETSGGDDVAYVSMQNEVHYEGEDGLRKKFTPREVDRVEFEYGEAYHVLISAFFGGGYYMMPAEVDNKLRVLRYFPTVSAEGSTIFETDEVNIRVLSIEGDNQGNNTKVFRLGFRKSMLDLFSNYPEMQKKIKDRTFTYDNWEEMVEYFNTTYGESDL